MKNNLKWLAKRAENKKPYIFCVVEPPDKDGKRRKVVLHQWGNPDLRKTPKEAFDFIEEGGTSEDGEIRRLAIVPEHVGLFVADVDDGGMKDVKWLEKKLGKAAAVVDTRRTGKRFHVAWFCHDASKLGRKTKLSRKGVVELQTQNHLIILHRPRTFIEKLRESEKKSRGAVTAAMVMEAFGIKEKKEQIKSRDVEGWMALKLPSEGRKKMISKDALYLIPAGGNPGRNDYLFRMAAWCGRDSNEKDLEKLVNNAIAVYGADKEKEIVKVAVRGWKEGIST